MRPMTMHPLGIALATAVLGLALAGCGSETGDTETAGPETGGTGTDGSEGASAQASGSPAMGGWQGCSSEDVERFEALADVDLDADGSAEPVRLVPASADLPCVGSLVTTTPDGIAGVALHGLKLQPESAEVVQLRGTDRQLLLVREAAHPRGGYQIRLFTREGGDLAEVTVSGNPIIPFVATDGGAAPGTATCTDYGGIAVLHAVTHKPPGVVLAWDVTRTVYELSGGTATEVSTELVEDGTADPLLRKNRPQLFEPEGRLADCIVGAPDDS